MSGNLGSVSLVIGFNFSALNLMITPVVFYYSMALKVVSRRSCDIPSWNRIRYQSLVSLSARKKIIDKICIDWSVVEHQSMPSSGLRVASGQHFAIPDIVHVDTSTH